MTDPLSILDAPASIVEASEVEAFTSCAAGDDACASGEAFGGASIDVDHAD